MIEILRELGGWLIIVSFIAGPLFLGWLLVNLPSFLSDIKRYDK